LQKYYRGTHKFWGAYLDQEFVKAHHKITPMQRKKRRWPWAKGAPQNFGVPLKYFYNGWGSPSIFTQCLKLGSSNLVHSLGLSRPTIKPHP